MPTLPSSAVKQLVVCFVVSMPLFMAGTSLGWSSPMMQYVTRGESPIYLNSAQESWMVTSLDIGNVLLSIPSGLIMDFLGRKKSVYLTLPLSLAGWILILTARQIWYLYAARFLHGCALVISLTVCPTYVGEIASKSIRGSLALVYELTYAFGLLLAYVVGWLADYYTLAAVCATIPLITGALMVYVPESPYFLTMSGKPDEAAGSLRKFRNYDDDDAAFEKELDVVRMSVVNDKISKGQLTDLLNRDRVPLIIVLVLAVIKIASGISVMEAYASSVLDHALVSPNAGAVIFGVFVVLASVPFAFTVDNYGRRPLYIVSCFGTGVFHALIAVLLSTNASNATGRLLLASVCGAEFFINIGLMPLLSVVQCEYFPSDTRGLANSAVVLTTTTTSAIMLKSYQPVCDAYGKRANFIGYAVITFLGGLFCYFFVPETKGKTFLEIQSDFETYRLCRRKKTRGEYQEI